MPTKFHGAKGMFFPVVMYGYESWTIKKAESWRMDAFELWCWRRLLRVPWTGRRSNQSILKEISPEYSLRTDAEAEASVLWPPAAKNWLTGKDLDAGKDWRWEEKGATEDEMVRWHHWPDGHEQVPGVGDGQGSLTCCSPWGCKELDMTEQLNWTESSLTDTLQMGMNVHKTCWVLLRYTCTSKVHLAGWLSQASAQLVFLRN